jgi:hypothetical protein
LGTVQLGGEDGEERERRQTQQEGGAEELEGTGQAPPQPTASIETPPLLPLLPPSVVRVVAGTARVRAGAVGREAAARAQRRREERIHLMGRMKLALLCDEAGASTMRVQCLNERDKTNVSSAPLIQR